MIEGIENYRKAGSIARKVKDYAKSIIKKGTPLIEIAEKIENRIISLGGKPAFPVNLSINGVAAHYTPGYKDETLAFGLLKIDFGVNVEGYIVDTAFSLDLENDEENKKLILASEKALENVMKKIKEGIEICEIGKVVQETITSFNFSPVRNLSGHEIRRYNLHAGITIPNYDNNNKNKIYEGVYAIEPFSTNGVGEVYESKPSGIYMLKEKKVTRIGREILNYIWQEYKTLPFCERWLIKKFGEKVALNLKFLEQQGILYQFSQLREKKKGKVAQTEHTILVAKEKTEILT